MVFSDVAFGVVCIQRDIRFQESPPIGRGVLHANDGPAIVAFKCASPNYPGVIVLNTCQSYWVISRNYRGFKAGKQNKRVDAIDSVAIRWQAKYRCTSSIHSNPTPLEGKPKTAVEIEKGATR